MYIYFNLSSTITSGFFSGHIYLSFGNSIDLLTFSSSILLLTVLENPIILSAILLPVKSPVGYADF